MNFIVTKLAENSYGGIDIKAEGPNTSSLYIYLKKEEKGAPESLHLGSVFVVSRQ
jgi:hypothetical protein